MRYFGFTIWLALILTVSACEKASGQYQLKYVQDGDSLVICCEQGDDFTVRLRDIDAPEKGQPHANESREFLKQLLRNQTFQLKGKETDRYNRRLVDIILKNGEEALSVNQIMIENGQAWTWRYSESLKLQYLQKKAREQKKGLWALPENEIQDPWLWRKEQRNKNAGQSK